MAEELKLPGEVDHPERDPHRRAVTGAGGAVEPGTLYVAPGDPVASDDRTASEAADNMNAPFATLNGAVTAAVAEMADAEPAAATEPAPESDPQPAAPPESPAPAPRPAESVELDEVEAAIAKIGNPHLGLTIGETRRAALTVLRRFVIDVIDIEIGQQMTVNNRLSAERQATLGELERLVKRRRHLRGVLGLPEEPLPQHACTVTPEMTSASCRETADAIGIELERMVMSTCQARCVNRRVPMTAKELQAELGRTAASLGLTLDVAEADGGLVIRIGQAE